MLEFNHLSFERNVSYLKSDKLMSTDRDTNPLSRSDLSLPLNAKPLDCRAQSAASARLDSEAPCSGILIINADDWGRDHETTQRILECTLRGTVSSASAMVFMEDSERAAE